MLRKLKHWISEAVTALIRLLPVRNRVFFYTIRSNDVPLDNLKCIFDAVKTKKILFAHMLPHTFSQMMRARFYLLTSRVIVTDDYIRYLRQVRLHPSQKVIQLWHAAGAFKRFGLDAPSRLTAEDERATHAQYTDVIVSSEGVRSYYAGSFGIPVEKVKALGVPRTDALYDPAWQVAAKSRLLRDLPMLQGKTIYLYAPTFRETDGTVTDYDPQIDFCTLDAALQGDELFVLRLHPVMQTPRLPDGLCRIVDLSDISSIELLTVADVLVTDYSSIIFDASILHVPTVFYCPDLAGYERTFYLDFDHDLPGEIITDGTELLAALRKAKDAEDAQRYAAFFDSQLSACDGHAAQRVIELIRSYLK